MGKRLYTGLALIAVVFFLSYWFWVLYPIALFLAAMLLVLFVVDFLLIFGKREGVLGKRELPEKFSNSDENEVEITLANRYSFPLRLFVLDEIPEQFQKRDFGYFASLASGETRISSYVLTPKQRGEYRFGSLHVVAYGPLGLVAKRYSFDDSQMVKVYPSFLQMRRYEFLAFNALKREHGLKKLRRFGQSREFEQIKPYVTGDDLRNLNWKAAAKSGKLMTNHYQEEKSQPVYSIIDLGRVMKMPFEGLSLLDYAINSSLVFSNIALKNGDKAGLATFSNQIGPACEANHRPTQLLSVMELLYNIKTGFPESDFGKLYSWARKKLGQKCLLMIYTNFEHAGAMRRQLPFLKALAKHHLVLVVIFENHLLEEFSVQPADTLSGIVEKTIAAKFIYDKRLIAKELNRHGIQTILCAPQELSMQTINKYMEIKAKGLI
ncbi:uncharacterized protein (DUF58 family) [Algoriphagus sp. 4150]|uniref:DUF58 domain-containing protein n=1 Tax=Algoriphagus sp. 4150 TaxID=2817756 RepID=UPI0028643FBA|nr:DUF58 domain-containing protein [Algoriphagus sp. 4150]MDR7129336.1 uncharacterized protein (DUF58 family) [Algoriphagus sp. 4150]